MLLVPLTVENFFFNWFLCIASGVFCVPIHFIWALDDAIKLENPASSVALLLLAKSLADCVTTSTYECGYSGASKLGEQTPRYRGQEVRTRSTDIGPRGSGQDRGVAIVEVCW